MTKQAPTLPANLPLQYCAIKPAVKRAFEAEVGYDRAEFILDNGNYWVNGTKLLYCFYTDGENASDVADGAEMDLVRQAFAVWKDIGLGITFEETETLSLAHFRIAFKRGAGAWSYVGRHCLTVPLSAPTMNFGWNMLLDPRKVGVAIHEIGHAIGLLHEHQNSNAGIVWNEPAVLAFFSGPPNYWSESTIRSNILDKVPNIGRNNSRWDPDSIMEYGFPAGLITAPEPYDKNGIHPPGNRLSQADEKWAIRCYPPLGENDYRELQETKSVALNLDNGAQASFRFAPKSTRQYEIRLFGEADAVMVVFMRDQATNTYLTGTDDSGSDANAYAKLRLEAGKEYLINARLLYQNPDSRAAIMVW